MDSNLTGKLFICNILPPEKQSCANKWAAKLCPRVTWWKETTLEDEKCWRMSATQLAISKETRRWERPSLFVNRRPSKELQKFQHIIHSTMSPENHTKTPKSGPKRSQQSPPPPHSSSVYPEFTNSINMNNSQIDTWEIVTWVVNRQDSIGKLPIFVQ